VPVAGFISPARGRAWKSAGSDAQIDDPMGFSDHRDALKAAELRVESIKVSL
jgi:hypothetical protein